MKETTSPPPPPSLSARAASAALRLLPPPQPWRLPLVLIFSTALASPKKYRKEFPPPPDLCYLLLRSASQQYGRAVRERCFCPAPPRARISGRAVCVAVYTRTNNTRPNNPAPLNLVLDTPPPGLYATTPTGRL